MAEQDTCKTCGTPASPGAKFCESCGAPLAQAAPSAPAEPTPQPQTQEQPQYAQPPSYPGYQMPPTYAPPPSVPYEGVAIRFVAILIDQIILAIITAIIVTPLGLLAATTVTVDQTTGAVSITNGAVIASYVLIILAIEFLYFTLLEGTYGQTVGKMAVKIRVVKEEDGSRIHYGEAAIRTILRIIDGLVVYLIGAILIWSSDKKQRLGDRVAHTVVVRA